MISNLSAQRSITIDAGTDLKLHGSRVSIEADSEMTASAQVIQLN